MTEREKIDIEIFDLRQEVNRYLRCNESETANKLLDQIAALERVKANLVFVPAKYR